MDPIKGLISKINLPGGENPAKIARPPEEAGTENPKATKDGVWLKKQIPPVKAKASKEVKAENQASLTKEETPAPPPATITMLEEEKTTPEEVRNFVPSEKDAKLIETPTTVQNMGKIARSIKLNQNVLLVGSTGAGKTALIKYLAFLSENELRRINLSDMTDITEIIGGYKPDSKTGRPAWQDGIVPEAMKKGQWLLLDEINLAEPAILERLNSLFDDDRLLVLSEKDNEVVKPHPDFRVFATMNPASYAGRKELSEAMMNRLHQVWIDPLKPEEMVTILQKNTDLSEKSLLQMAMFHNTITDMASHRQLGKKEATYPFTLRDLLKWTARINHYKEESIDLNQIIRREARHIYQDRFKEEADKKVVEDVLKVTFGKTDEPQESPKEMVSLPDGRLKIGEAVIPVNTEGGSLVPGPEAELVNTRSTLSKMEKIAKCAALDEPALLVGPTAAGKTSMINYLSRLTNNDVRRYNLSLQTDVTEFIGGYKPTGVPGEYVWQDGILLDAMKKGDWVILDELNLAEPAILERLNSLLDKDRILVLTEKGNETVKAHPNFRMFATMNPASYAGRKDLSLAMRNRFTELWIDEVKEKGELTQIMSAIMKGLPQGEQLAEKMVNFQLDLKDKTQKREIGASKRGGYVYTLRNLKSWAKYLKAFRETDGIEKAFKDGAMHCYADEMQEENDRKTIANMAKQHLGA